MDEVWVVEEHCCVSGDEGDDTSRAEAWPDGGDDTRREEICPVPSWLTNCSWNRPFPPVDTILPPPARLRSAWPRSFSLEITVSSLVLMFCWQLPMMEDSEEGEEDDAKRGALAENKMDEDAWFLS